MAQEEIKAGDSVAWGSNVTGAAYGSKVWGLVDSVNEDGTLTILSGAYQRKVTKNRDEITRHEPGPQQFLKVYPGSRMVQGRRR